MPYFETRNHTVFSPGDERFKTFYEILEKYAPVIGDSPLFGDLVDIYETLDFDSEMEKMKEAKK
jgi:hypothetical protein